MEETTKRYNELIAAQDKLICEQNVAIKNITEYKKVVDVYINMNKTSYAMVQNISTISKLRILKPLNKFDPILSIKVPNAVLNKIDDKLIELFTAR